MAGLLLYEPWTGVTLQRTIQNLGNLMLSNQSVKVINCWTEQNKCCFQVMGSDFGWFQRCKVHRLLLWSLYSYNAFSICFYNGKIIVVSRIRSSRKSNYSRMTWKAAKDEMKRLYANKAYNTLIRGTHWYLFQSDLLDRFSSI